MGLREANFSLWELDAIVAGLQEIFNKDPKNKDLLHLLTRVSTYRDDRRYVETGSYERKGY